MRHSLPKAILAIMLVGNVAGQPCTRPDSACTEMIATTVGNLTVFRTMPIKPGSAKVERALLMVHGVLRNGGSYFGTAVTSTMLAAKLETTLVIAPNFAGNDGAGCWDPVAPSELNFPCDGWTDGQHAVNAKTTSFGAIDQLLTLLGNKEKFPNLKEIVIAGHSSGAQFTQRYAAANRIDGKLPVPIRYIVANPSSYVYLDRWRPQSEPCPEYDQYRYGLTQLTGYIVATGVDAVRKQYPKRNVTYLLGERDTRNAAHMDTSCSANAQGPHRFARGQAFFKHLNETYPSTHKLIVVPDCHHNADCMFRSQTARDTLFGSGNSVSIK